MMMMLDFSAGEDVQEFLETIGFLLLTSVPAVRIIGTSSKEVCYA
jgi:hypothetical protein